MDRGNDNVDGGEGSVNRGKGDDLAGRDDGSNTSNSLLNGGDVGKDNDRVNKTANWGNDRVDTAGGKVGRLDGAYSRNSHIINKTANWGSDRVVDHGIEEVLEEGCAEGRGGQAGNGSGGVGTHVD